MRLSVRFLSAAVAGGVAFVGTPVVARAQIAVLSSTVEEHEAMKGETYSGRIVIANSTSVPQPVRIYQTDYTFDAVGGNVFGDPGSMARSNAPWVKPQSQNVVVPPRSELTVPYSVKVPALDSLRGTYWSMIMVAGAETAPSAASKGGNVGIGSVVRYGIQVATHIGSSGRRTVKFSNPAASHTANGAALDVDVTSSGDRATRPILSVELYDAQGVMRGKGRQVRGLLYPGTSLRQHFEFASLPPGTYKALVFADTGEDPVLAQQFTITY
jgi:hypothetical protein